MPNIYYIPGKGYGKFDDNVTLEEAYKRYGIATAAPQARSAKNSSDVARGFGGAVSGIGSTLQDIGFEDTGKSLQKWGQDVVNRNPADYNSISDIKGPGDVAGFAWEKFKENVPQFGLGLAAGVAGGPVAAGALLGGTTLAQQYGDTRQAQRAKGIDDRGRAFMTALPAAALDVGLGGEGAILRAFGKTATEEAGKSLLKTVGKTALEEAATEPVQSALQRYGSYDSLTDAGAINDYATSALAGGLVGGMVGGALHPFMPSGTQSRPPLQNEDQTTSDAGKDLLRLPAPTAYVDSEGQTRYGSDSLTEAERQASAGAKYEAMQRQRAGESLTSEQPDLGTEPVAAPKPAQQLPSDEVKSIFNKENVFNALHAEAGSEPTDFSTKLSRSLTRAFKTGGIKSAENLENRLGKDLDEDMHGATEVEARLPYVQRAQAIIANYKDMMSEALRRDEELTNPKLIAERAAARNAEELARVQAAREQQQADLIAENARIEAQRKAELDATAQKVEAIHRKGILDQVAKDPNTRDPVARFTALLKRNGFNPQITQEEQAALGEAAVNAEARLAGEAAKMDMSVSEYKQKLAEDEALQRSAENGTASMEAQIREAGTRKPTPRQATTPEPGKTNRVAPDNFQLEMQSELTDADIEAQQKAAARRQAREDRALAKMNARAEKKAAQAQGEMFTPTGKVSKAAEATATKQTVASQIKEKVSAAKEGQKPKGRVAERQGTNEKRTAPEAGRGNRVEPSAKVEEKVTHEQVAERAVEAKQNGYINENTRQKIAMLAEQKKVPAETLNKMLDQAVEKGGIEPTGKAAMAEKPNTKTSTRAERGQLADALKRELQRLGLNKVGLGVVTDLVNIFESGKAAGRYMPGWGMIDVVYADLKQAMETLHHEVIHYLRDANLFTDSEWETLSAAARADKKLMDRIDRDWPTLNNEEKTEEAIAEMFREWMRTQKAAQPGIRGVFQKLKNFIMAMRKGFNKPEFAAVKSIFTEINQGKRNDQSVETLRGDPTGNVKMRIEQRLDKENVPSQIGRQTGFVAEKFNEFYNKFARKGMMHTLIESAIKAGLKMAGVYQDIELDKQRVRYNIEQRISKVLEGFDSLDKRWRTIGGAINSLLQDSTMSGKWAFAPSWLKEGSYEVDPALQERFNALPEKGQKFIREVFEVNHDLRKQLMETVDAAIDEPYDRLIAEAVAAGDGAQVRELKREREGLRAQKTLMFRVDPTKPYASLRRQGNFAVSAKSAEFVRAQEGKDNKLIQELQSAPEHNYFNKFETEAEARAEAKRLQGLGIYSDVVATTDDSVVNDITGGRETFQAFQRIFKALEDREGLSQQAKRTLQSVITDLHVMSMTNSSARKSEIKRKNVYGGDLDMVRNFATQSRAMAYHIASLKNNDKLMEAINGMNKEVRAAPDTMEASKFRDEILLRHVAGLRVTPSTLVETMKRLTAVYKIAFSPSFYIQNFTQVPMVTGPELAARAGIAKATQYMNGAMGDVAKAWKGTKWTESLNIDALPSDVRGMIQQLADISLIDVGLDADLGNMKSIRGRAGEKWGATGESLDQAAQVLASGTNIAQDLTRKQESINRVVTAIAGYRLELEKSGSKQKALEYATDLVRNTMGTYDGFNAPRYMQGIGGIPFQFRKFQLMQITLLLRHLKNGYTDPDVSPEERAVARQALKYQLGTAALMGGLRGLPGATALIWAYNTFFSDDDEPADAESEIRKAVGDKEIADFLIYGPPSMADVNLSSMIGFGNTFSVLPYTKLEMTKEGIAKAAFDLGGAGPATLRDIALSAKDTYDGLKEGREDYYRGLEKMLPKGFSNAVAAYRESTEGVKNYKNDQLLSPDEVSFEDTFKTLLGVQSVETSERFRKQEAEKSLDQFYKDKATLLKRQYVNALASGDQAARQEAMANWRELQDARVQQGKKRQPMSQLLKAKSEQQKQEKMTVGGVQYRAKDARYRAALAEEQADQEDQDEEE